MATATEGFFGGVITTIVAILVIPKVVTRTEVAKVKGAIAGAKKGAKKATVDVPARYVTDANGEKLRVRKRGGEWEYYYDREWTPLRYLGGPGHHWEIRGDRLIDR